MARSYPARYTSRRSVFRKEQIPAAVFRRRWVGTRGGTSVSVTPTTGSLILTGYAPTVATPRLVTPTTGTLVLQGYAPTVATPVAVTPTTGPLVLTGYAPTVATPVVVTPMTGSLVLTGYAPTVTTGGTSVAVTPDTLTLTLTGYAPDVLVQTPVRIYGVPPLKPRRRPAVREIQGVGYVAVVTDAQLVGEKALSRTVDIRPYFYAQLIRSMFWGIEITVGGPIVAEFQASAAMPFDAEGWGRAIRLKPLSPAPVVQMGLFRGSPAGEMRLRSNYGLHCNGAAIAARERVMMLKNLVTMPQGIGTSNYERTVSGRLPVTVGVEAAPLAQENEEQIVLFLLGLPNAYQRA